MLLDTIEQRVLGAFRFSDRSTGGGITRYMSIAAENASYFRKTNGLYVITAADGLEHHLSSFESPPDYPALGAVGINLRIEDPQGYYLPRLVRIRLPREPDPKKMHEQDSLFQPVNILLYSSETARLSDNWSTVRVSVNKLVSGQPKKPVTGALLRIVSLPDEKVLSSGISDSTGTALIIVPGIPIINFSQIDEDTDPVSVKTSVRLELSFRSLQDWPVNPDLLERDHTDSIKTTEEFSLQTGKMIRMNIDLQPDP